MEKRAFVSFDISSHSAERDQAKQVERIASLNEIVAQILRTPEADDPLWASGGDGGHIVFTLQGAALGVPNALRTLQCWSIDRGVALRIVSHVGTATTVLGADGRTQIVGDGINLCGSLIEVAPAAAILVTEALKEFFSPELNSKTSDAGSDPLLLFHDPRNVYLKHFHMKRVYLCSISKERVSAWGPLHRSDRTMLGDAMRAGAAWDVIFYSKRIVQMNSSDPEATEAIKNAILGDYGELVPEKREGVSRSSLFLTIDPPSFLSFVTTADLVERRDGEVICNQNDPGDTMFIVLQGELALVITVPEDRDKPTTTSKYAQAITFGPGDIVGELAVALRTKRTATLQAIGDASLLSFSYQSLQQLLKVNEQNERANQALTRFIDVRVLDYICNHADYLVGLDKNKDKRGPLSEVRQPWESLYTYSRSKHWQEGQSFDSSKEWFSKPGLYVLASGTLAKRTFEMPAKRAFEGLDLPPISINFPGRLISNFATYKVTSSYATTIHISEYGLNQWGSQLFEDVLRSISRSVAVTFEYDVFISFALEDRDLANQIEFALTAQGLSVYLDKLDPGKYFAESIPGAIVSSLLFVVLNTPSIAQKQVSRGYRGEKTWVEREIVFRKSAVSGEHNIIPLRVGDSQIIPYLRWISYIDVPLVFDDKFASKIRLIVNEIKNGQVMIPSALPIKKRSLID